MCAHAVIICYFIKLRLFHTTEYDKSDETVKDCLSHRYVMKLHMHTSHENDEMRTHEWPQFVQDDVVMTYMLWMNSFVYAAETAYDKKKPKNA